jgi:hypothetical protein
MAAWSVAVTVLAAPHVVHGQPSGNGFVFGGLGAASCSGCGSTPLLNVGGGGELRPTDRVGIEAELGLLGPTASVASGVGLASVDGVVRLATPTTAFRPFVVGGYAVLIGDGVIGAADVGVGVEHWRSRRIGVRVEVRDRLPIYDEGRVVHYLQVRVGLMFR